MPAFLVVAINVKDAQQFRGYQKALMPTLKVGEGQVLAASKAERLEGDDPRELNVIIQFPSVEMLKRWYSSEEYKKVIPLREVSAPGANIMIVEGLQ